MHRAKRIHRLLPPSLQHLPPKGTNAPRLIQTFMYLHARPADNAYARPLDFVPVVDLNARKVPCPAPTTVGTAAWCMSASSCTHGQWKLGQWKFGQWLPWRTIVCVDLRIYKSSSLNMRYLARQFWQGRLLVLQVVHIDMQHGDAPPPLPDTDVNYHSELAGQVEMLQTMLYPSRRMLCSE